MMVVIVGGGLTGLSAAFELDRLGISYTLIEVKGRLGGSILTRREAGFVMDGSAFVLEKYGDWAWLDDLDLRDALVNIGRYRDGELVIFRDGTETLIDALKARLRGTILTRMAVSSLGTLPNATGQIGVCLENGVLIDTRAAIVTAPARYAAHMLWSLTPAAAWWLDEYEYDPIVRVSFGYRRDDLTPHPPTPSHTQARRGGDSAEVPFQLPDPPPGFKFVEAYQMPERVPEDHVLVRMGVRLSGEIKTTDDAIKAARALIPAEPMLTWAHYWSEADPLTRHLPEHDEVMNLLDLALPPNVVVAGSDYRAKRLDQQVEQGRAAARQIAEI